MYYETKAWAAAVKAPFHATAYADWSHHEPVFAGFETREEAEAWARSRPEPLIDLVQRNLGVIACRRVLQHPAVGPLGQRFEPKDDFAAAD